MRHGPVIAALLSAAVLGAAAGGPRAPLPTEIVANHDYFHEMEVVFDHNFRPYILVGGDTVHIDYLPALRTGPLKPLDYIEVAEALGVDVASIKAVVEIETGRTHQGIVDSLTVINFDLPVFRQMAAKRGINLAKYTASHPTAFASPNVRKYGSRLAAEHAILSSAMDIDSLAAIEGTFWGMFQIGGFNWRQCGAESPQQFVALMNRSERDQLDLFAEFIVNSGLLKHLKAKNWAAFAKGYNGPSYAERGYHTRLAAAYRKYASARM